MKMSIEIEKMNSKARYDLGAKEKKKKKMRVEAVTDHKTGDCKDKKVEDMSLLEIFDKCKDRFVFNPLENSINFAQRKPTDYKLNRNIILPKPLGPDLELQCELRRHNFIKALEVYQTEIKDRQKMNSREREKDGVKKDKEEEKKSKGLANPSNRHSKNKKNKDPLKLTCSEIDAMKSLKEKIKEGTLIITQTDKSSRFAVLTKDQYLQSGKSHTIKDKKITWREVNYLQSQVNNHVWWLAQIVGYSKNTD